MCGTTPRRSPRLTNSSKGLDPVQAAVAAAASGTFGPTGRKPLVSADCSYLKTFLIMLYSHLCVALLCINVIFDLVIYGLPAYFLLLPFSKRAFRKYMTALTNYTTPIVFNLPMILSGTKVRMV